MYVLTAWTPECLLLAGALVVLFTGLLRPPPFLLSGLTQIFLGLSGLALGFACFMSVANPTPDLWFLDHFACGMKLLIALSAWFVVGLGARYTRDEGMGGGEYYALILCSVLGMFVVSSAAHFMVLFAGLELFALCIYALVASQRSEAKGLEAAIKYFITGALASGLLLYGLSLLYGATGVFGFASMHKALLALHGAHPMLLAFGLMGIVCGMAFKLGVVPFHLWVPDVYEGAPVSMMVWIGTVAKLAAFAVWVRLFWGVLAPIASIWQPIMLWLGLLSILIGNIAAIAQDHFQRMLAYSSIAHMGYLLLAIHLNQQATWSASLFYLLAYVLGTLVAMGVMLLLHNKDVKIGRIASLAGLHQTHPCLAFLMLLAMFSLAGIPPFFGFVAKWQLISQLVIREEVVYAVFAMLMAVVGAYYYLRVVRVMYFDAPRVHPSEDGGGGKAVPDIKLLQHSVARVSGSLTLVCGLGLLVFGVCPTMIPSFL